MSVAAAFGQIVREARIKRGLSQEEFAERCGVERGERTPNLDTIVGIAQGLEMRLSSHLPDITTRLLNGVVPELRASHRYVVAGPFGTDSGRQFMIGDSR